MSKLGRRLVSKAGLYRLIPAFIIVLFSITGIHYLLASKAATPCVPADIVPNCKVDINDFNKLKANFGMANPTAADGDLNGDHQIDAIDLSILLSAWGDASQTSGAPATPADTGADICPGGTHTSELVSPYATAPASGFMGTVSTVTVSGNSMPAMVPNTTYYITAGVHKIGQVLPDDHDVIVGAPGAVLDGNHTSENAFASYTNNAQYVTIEYLTIKNYVSTQDQWIVNVDSAPNWTVTRNTIGPNDDGAALGMGDNSTITYNCIIMNGQYGINGYDNNDNITGHDHAGSRGGPVYGGLVDHNEFSTNDVRTIKGGNYGNGCTSCGYDNYPSPANTPDDAKGPGGTNVDFGFSGGMKFWREQDTVVSNNYIHDNHNIGIWADSLNVGLDIHGNYISRNWNSGLMYEISYNAKVNNNTFAQNGIVRGTRKSDFPIGAIYMSESGWDSRVDNGSGEQYEEIGNNNFVDNWGGVVLWESSDRFCHHTDGDFCTLPGPPTVPDATPAKCTTLPTSEDWNCRFNMQNAYVNHNNFQFSPTNVDAIANSIATSGDLAAHSYPIRTSQHCIGVNHCGQNATVSQYSSSSAYGWTADQIPYAVTWGGRTGTGSGHDGALASVCSSTGISPCPSNIFDYNTYTGPWIFDVLEVNSNNSGLSFMNWQTTVGTNDGTQDNPNDPTHVHHPAQDVHSTCTGCQ